MPSAFLTRESHAWIDQTTRKPVLCSSVHGCLARGDWQLQHGHGLPFAQIGDANDPSIWEFQRIMMRIAFVQIDLPESGHLLPSLSEPKARHNATKNVATFRLLIKGNLGTGKKAYCHIRFSDCSKATCDGIAEFRCQQLVPDPSRSRCYGMQAVIAHLKVLPHH